MPTLLDNVLEKHEGTEPRVLLSDVQEILREVIRPGSKTAGESVMLVAARAGVSTRTVYRVLNPPPEKTTLSLDQADNLLVACESHLSHVRLVHPDGSIGSYF